MHLVGSIVKIYYEARSPEHQKRSNSIVFKNNGFL